MCNRVIWPAIVCALLGCGKKPEPPAPAQSEPARGPASRYAADKQGFVEMMAALRDGTDAEVAALWRDLTPTREDLRKILKDDRVVDDVARIWEINRAKDDRETAQAARARGTWTVADVLQATTEDLLDQTEAGGRFRPEIRKAAKALKPGLLFYGLPPIQMFFHDGARWIYTGKLEWYVR